MMKMQDIIYKIYYIQSNINHKKVELNERRMWNKLLIYIII